MYEGEGWITAKQGLQLHCNCYQKAAQEKQWERIICLSLRAWGVEKWPLKGGGGCWSSTYKNRKGEVLLVVKNKARGWGKVWSFWGPHNARSQGRTTLNLSVNFQALLGVGGWFLMSFAEFESKYPIEKEPWLLKIRQGGVAFTYLKALQAACKWEFKAR